MKTETGDEQAASKGAVPKLWTAVGPLESLEEGSLTTFKHGKHQLVLARTDEGAVHALDNRCPHEGYPLAQGDLKGQALTCCWHNWKFDVRDGACRLGGEDVRSYRTRIVEGVVEVDLADPDPRDAWPALRASLETGLWRNELGRAVRDGVRLVLGGYDPWALLADVARFDAKYAEYGTTHALAAAADCGRALATRSGSEALVAIAPAMDMAGDANRRLPERKQPAPLAPSGSRDGAGAELRAAVEAEDGERAEGLLLGAIEAGVDRATVERWLADCLTDHFLDFGHELIYLVKAQELFSHAGAEDAWREVYPALLAGIVFGTREDTLPYWKSYTARFGMTEERLAELYRSQAAGDPEARVPEVLTAVADGTAEEACNAVLDALASGVSARAVARELVAAAATRLWRFDDAHDRDPEVAETWVWATHRFTFSSAVRNALERFEGPHTLRFLFQAVGFVHSGKPMDVADEERRALPQPESSDLGGVLEAIASRAPRVAVARARGYLAGGGDIEALRLLVEELCLSDPVVRPIVVVHAIKTTVAAFEEHGVMAGHPDRELPVLAALRFLASPIVERRVRALVHTSRAWVEDGVVPRKLTQ